MDIVAFYQDATQHAGDEDAVWRKFEDAKGAKASAAAFGNGAAPGKNVYEKPVSCVALAQGA